jgi:glycosyltransferase involved in cell wall biosynthesis
MKILFLTQGDQQVASSRHRVYQFLPALKEAGIEAVVHPAVAGEEFYEAFISRSFKGNFRRLFRTFTRRVRDLHQLGSFDYVYVQKPILPAPLFNMELRIARQAKMIFDFDDAIYTKRVGPTPLTNNWPQARRVASICKRAHRVIVGSEELARFARNLNIDPYVIPTVVDTEAYAARSSLHKRAHKIPVIGWVGSPSTQSDLSRVMPSLIELHSKVPFVVRVIGGLISTMPVRFPIEWKAWNLKTEVEDVANLDYGLAPLHDTTWNHGKCGLKVLQYWAAGVPVVASPVGIYKEIIRDGENGLLAANDSEWSEKLLMLIKSRELRHKIIAGGHKTVEEKFSLKAQAPRFVQIFGKPSKDMSEEKDERKQKEQELASV